MIKVLFNRVKLLILRNVNLQEIYLVMKLIEQKQVNYHLEAIFINKPIENIKNFLQ